VLITVRDTERNRLEAAFAVTTADGTVTTARPRIWWRGRPRPDAGGRRSRDI
jgi:hypothetical protein